MQQTPPASRTLLPAAGLLVSLAGLVGCAQTQPFQGYPGPVQPASETALVEIPAEIRVQSIDGEPFKAKGWDSLRLGKTDNQLSLLPGPHILRVYYEVIVTPRSDVDEYSRIRTQSTDLRFVAKPGQRYQLTYEEPPEPPLGSIAHPELKARIMASGAPLTTSVAPAKTATNQPAPQPTPHKAASPDTAPPSSLAREMQALWEKASPEERKEMLNWMFDHR